jgi:chromate transporter
MSEPPRKSAQEFPAAEKTSLRELAMLFLRLGTTAFGGPAAHIAIMEDEFVLRRKWLSPEKFLDLLGTVNLIPGPNSTEMAIHIGYLRAGWPGLVVAGSCFIIPAMLMVMAIAWAYVRFGSLPEIAGLLYGVKPVVIVVVANALWGLGRTALKTKFLTCVGILVAVANFLGADPLVLLLMAGALLGVRRGVIQERPMRIKATIVMFIFVSSLLALISLGKSLSVTGEKPFSLLSLLMYFLKVGSVLYGSGYVLLAFLQTDLVDHWHWLSASQLLDATAVGQVTPGPVFTTATFVGYLLGNWPGALIATAGIFLPAFVFIAISVPIVPRLRQSMVANSFLDGVNVASLALMAVVTWSLGCAAIIDPITILIAVAGAILFMRYRINSTWLVFGGAVVGLIVKAI